MARGIPTAGGFASPPRRTAGAHRSSEHGLAIPAVIFGRAAAGSEVNSDAQMMHKMASLFLVFGLSSCGGGDDDAVGSFDDELPSFRTTLCDVAATCAGQNRAMCEADVSADMADAKAQLDDTGELRCARCMHVKTVEGAKILDASCDLRAASEAAILAECDLNPAADYDGDGTAGNDDDEACAGFP